MDVNYGEAISQRQVFVGPGNALGDKWRFLTELMKAPDSSDRAGTCSGIRFHSFLIQWLSVFTSVRDFQPTQDLLPSYIDTLANTPLTLKVVMSQCLHGSQTSESVFMLSQSLHGSQTSESVVMLSQRLHGSQTSQTIQMNTIQSTCGIFFIFTNVNLERKI